MYYYLFLRKNYLKIENTQKLILIIKDFCKLIGIFIKTYLKYFD